MNIGLVMLIANWISPFKEEENIVLDFLNLNQFLMTFSELNENAKKRLQCNNDENEEH